MTHCVVKLQLLLEREEDKMITKRLKAIVAVFSLGFCLSNAVAETETLKLLINPAIKYIAN